MRPPFQIAFGWLIAWLVVWSLTTCSVTRADESLLPKCQSALSACDVLQKAQAAEITVLRDSVKEYKRIVEAPRSDAPLALWTAVAGALGGAAAGQAASGQAGSLALGGLVGGVAGLLVGIVVGR